MPKIEEKRRPSRSKTPQNGLNCVSAGTLIALFFPMKIILLLLSFTLSTAYGFIDWSKLKNPVYQKDGWSVKDASMIYHEETGYFHLFFSAFFESDGRIRSHVASVKTKDFISFSEPVFVWHGKEIGYKGFAAPEILKVEDKYILTYNSWGDKPGKFNQLFYAVSTDLENWDKHHHLAGNITENRRVIDAAMTVRDGKYILNYKTGLLKQKSRIATADSLEGPWKRIGQPIKTWMENGQFIDLDGKLHLLMTGEGHLPYLSQFVGGGKNPLLNWGDLRKFELPLESFNTHDRANAAHLKDWRNFDGYFYLLYAGTTESDSYIGRGDNKLGLARSKDLIHWKVP